MTTPPPLPERFDIPEALVAQWVTIPLNQEIEAKFTRRLVEHLFFALDKTQRAQGQMHECIIHLSSGRVAEANEALAASQRETVESSNRLRQFLMEIMAEATRPGV